MAKSEDLNIPVEFSSAFNDALYSGIYYDYTTLKKKYSKITRAMYFRLAYAAGFGELAQLWARTSSLYRGYWREATFASEITPFANFVKTNNDRVTCGESFTKSDFNKFSGRCGLIKVNPTTPNLLLKQTHLGCYTESIKYPGGGERWFLNTITEEAKLPFRCGFQASVHLVDSGGTASFRPFIRFRLNNSGTLYDYDVNLGKQNFLGSAYYYKLVTSLPHALVGYDFYIEIKNASGWLLLDRFSILYGSNPWYWSPKNWARDWSFENFDSVFSGDQIGTDPFWSVVGSIGSASLATVLFDGTHKYPTGIIEYFEFP